MRLSLGLLTLLGLLGYTRPLQISASAVTVLAKSWLIIRASPAPHSQARGQAFPFIKIV